MSEALAHDADLYDSPRVGRPRDPRVHAAIHAATLDLLVEHGYQATTIQAIARRAGVSAPSVYRRWSNKAELIEDAVFPSALLAPEELTGDLSVDLQPYCLLILRHLASPAVRLAIPGLLTEYQTNPAMWQQVVERSFIPMRDAFEEFITRSGRVPIASPAALFDVMLGALFTRALNVGAAGAEDFAREVSLIIRAALQPETKPGADPKQRTRTRST